MPFASADAAEGSVEEVARIVAQIRKRWPTRQWVLPRRPDELVRGANNVRYVLGLAGNRRLVAGSWRS